MSLSATCDKYLLELGKNGQRLFGFEDLQRAFYAGAEATYHAKHELNSNDFDAEIGAEIDRFKGQRETK